MPTVPSYDLPQVAPTAAPATRFDAPQMPDIAGKQQQIMGDAMLKTGAAIKTIADRIQADKDDAATKELDNKLAETYRGILHDKDNGYLTTLGKNAVDGRDAVAKALADARKNVESGITDDFQRQMFRQVADRRTETAMMQVDVHAAQQTKIWHEGESVARVKSSIADAVANSAGWNTPGSPFATAKATAVGEVEALAALRGYDSEQTAQLKAETLAGLHGTVLQNMVSLGQSKTAREYLEAAAPEIAKGAPDKLDNLRSLVKAAGVKDESASLAASLKGGLQQKLATLEEMRKNKQVEVDVYDETRRRVEHDWQMRKAMEAEGNKARAGALQDWSLKNPTKAFSDAPTELYAWAKSQGKLPEFYSFHQREGRPANRDVELKTRGDLLIMARENPDEFLKIYRDTAFKGYMDLGTQGMKEMQDRADMILSNGGRYKQEFNDATIDAAIPQALRAKDKKEELSAFVAIVDEEEQKWLKANKGKAPDAAAHAEVIKAANQEWIRIGKWWNSSAPAYQVRAMKDASAVPAEFYAKAVQAQQRNTGKVDEAEILRKWAQVKGTWKPGME